HLRSMWERLPGWFRTPFEAVADVIEGVWNIIAGIFDLASGDIDGFVKHWETALGFLGKAWDNLTGWVGDAVGTIFNLVEDVVGYVTGMEEPFTKTAEAIRDIFAKVFGAMYDATVATFENLFNFVQEKWEWIKGIYDKAMNAAHEVAEFVGLAKEDDSVIDGMTDEEINAAAAKGASYGLSPM